MDTRRHTPEADTGSETKVVKLTDLQPVGRIGGSTKPAIAVGFVAVAVIAFAAGNAIQSPKPSATPTAGPVAVASSVPTASAVPTPPRPTPTRKLVVPTPLPSANPWSWTRMRFLGGLEHMPSENMWSLGDHVLLLNQTFDAFDRPSWQLASINTGFGWDIYEVPAAIDRLVGGSVIDDHIWFVAHIPGVTPEQENWQLIGTQIGDRWESLGPVDGLPYLDGVSFLGRLGDVWVASTWAFTNTGVDPEMSWSDDGQHWKPAKVPAYDGEIDVFGGVQFRDRVLLLGRHYTTFEDAQYFLLETTDGQTWSEVPIGWPAGRSFAGLVCNVDTCVIAEQPFEVDGTTKHLWVTDDGEAWSRISLDLPNADPASSVQFMRATQDGFIAMAGYTDTVLLSADGRTWRTVDGVRPVVSEETLVNLAVAQDLIVGFGDSGSSELSNWLWRGSLKVLEAAP